MSYQDQTDKILQLAQSQPVLPMQVAKALNTNSLFASAMLSELVGKGKMNLSKLKVGSSPLYYLPEKSEQLQNFAGYLNEKDQRTFVLLREKKVLRDLDLNPLTRVSVKQIKDFSRPLEVTLGDKKEIFWKFYLTSDEEAAAVIKQMLQGPLEQPTTETIPQQAPPQTPAEKFVVPPKVENEPKEPVKAELSRVAKVVKQVQQKLVAKPKAVKKKVPVKDVFSGQLENYFVKNNIRVVEQNVVRKNSECDFIIEFDSPVGKVTYYCKAKNKKRVTDSDLSSALVQGQIKKLPVALLITGDLTKKAEEVLNQLKGLTIKKI